MTTKLTLYSGTLRILGERKLASLSEDNKARRVLDDIWDEGAVDYCLGQGQWSFATRTQELTASTSIEPSFGYANAFEIPSDWKATVAICTDSYFNSPLIGYNVEAGILYCDYETIYVKFVSNASTFGGDYSLWSISFVNYVQTYIALQACEILTQSKSKKADLEKDLKQARLIALNNDRQNKPAQFPVRGSWSRSRQSGGNQYFSSTGNFPV